MQLHLQIQPLAGQAAGHDLQHMSCQTSVLPSTIDAKNKRDEAIVVTIRALYLKNADGFCSVRPGTRA